MLLLCIYDCCCLIGLVFTFVVCYWFDLVFPCGFSLLGVVLVC